MSDYFTSQLKLFLETTKPQNIKIKNIQIWRKNNFIKLDITVKNIENGTTLYDCQQIHKLTSAWLIKESLTNNNITVKSEGIDLELFELEDYKDNIGKKLKIELKIKENNRKNFTGFLIDVKNDKLILKAEEIEYTLYFENIKKGKVIPNITR